MKIITLPVPNSDEERKLTLIFIFTFFFVPQKVIHEGLERLQKVIHEGLKRLQKVIHEGLKRLDKTF